MSGRVLSLFTGLGGLDLGLEAAGLEMVGSVEIDPVARQSLEVNRRTWPILAPHDVTAFATVKFAPTLSVDVIAGAPPCQPFSKAAQWNPTSRAGMADDRGLLILSVLDLVATLTPKVVILENVHGFVQGSTSVLPVVEDALSEIQARTGHTYELDHRVVNAHAYGVPQKRKRAIVVLSRIGPFPWPEPADPDDRPVAWDAIGNRGHVPPDLPAMSGKWADLLPSIPEGENYQWHTNRGGGQSLFAYRSRYWSFLLKLAKAEPAWTIAAQPGPATGPFHWDSRLLSIPELLLLQSFPSDWHVAGTRREQIRQIGNATPPALAEVLGRGIATMLGIESPKKLRLSVQRAGSIPNPSPVAPVVSKYRSLIDEYPDHPGTGKGPAHTHAAKH